MVAVAKNHTLHTVNDRATPCGRGVYASAVVPVHVELHISLIHVIQTQEVHHGIHLGATGIVA